MQVFRAYFKIIKKISPQLAIYVVVFVSLNFAMVKLNAEQTRVDFSETQVNMAFFSDDEPTQLAVGLKTYLAQHTNLVQLEDNKEALQDALFFQEVSYILRIPAGFTVDFLQGRDVQLQKTSLPSSAAAIHVDSLINRYLSTARLYLTGAGGISLSELAERIAQDLSIQTKVSYRTYGKVLNLIDSMTFSFNYSAYVLISLLILGVSSFMLVFNQPDLRRRNLCSPVSLRKQNSQVLLGNFVYAFACWVLMMFLNLALFGSAMFAEQVYLFALNAFVFTIVSLSMGFLVGSVTRTQVVQSAMSNVITMGMCFLGGVFVPQCFLSQSVVSIAQFLPTYWYVRANNEAAQLVRLNLETLTPILGYMAIQLGMAVTFLAIALVIIKQKQQSQTA